MNGHIPGLKYGHIPGLKMANPGLSESKENVSEIASFSEMMEFPWKMLIPISQVLKLNDPDFPGIFLVSMYPI